MGKVVFTCHHLAYSGDPSHVPVHPVLPSNQLNGV